MINQNFKWNVFFKLFFPVLKVGIQSLPIASDNIFYFFMENVSIPIPNCPTFFHGFSRLPAWIVEKYAHLIAYLLLF